jgi:GMP synthase-like glutamine amidotransferase
MKIGILKTDAVREEWAPTYGEYPDMFARLLGGRDPGLAFRTYDVRHGQYPADVDDCDAYLITGSRHGIYEDLPWIPPLLEFIRELDKRRKKLVGICFGHQAVAQALGGRTEKAAAGWGVGLHRHRFSTHPQWFDGGDPEFRILVTHQDQVMEPASGAQVLAGSEFCPNAVCQLGDHILTFQGHPEFVNDYSRAIMDFRREIIGEDVYQAGIASLQEQAEADRMADWILGFLKTL